WRMHELANFVHGISDVSTRQSQLLKGTNKLAIFNRIIEQGAVIEMQIGSGSNRRWYWLCF
ncbi:hypothetical protein Tco_1535529, partial [Tanacetum coccineum]